MEATEQIRPRREGFQHPEPSNGNGARPEAPLRAGQSLPQEPAAGYSAPQPPLPSQLRLPNEPPPPEPPLVDQYDEARRDIRETAETWPVVVHLLYSPVKTAAGQELWELKFRRPRAADINRVGNPTRVLWDGEVMIEERKMTYIMAQLANIQPTQLEDMDPRDWNACALKLRKFFLGDLRAW